MKGRDHLVVPGIFQLDLWTMRETPLQVRFIPRKIGEELVVIRLDRGTPVTLTPEHQGIFVKPHAPNGKQLEVNGVLLWEPLEPFRYSYLSGGERKEGIYPSEQDVRRQENNPQAGTIRLAYAFTRSSKGRRAAQTA